MEKVTKKIDFVGFLFSESEKLEENISSEELTKFKKFVVRFKMLEMMEQEIRIDEHIRLSRSQKEMHETLINWLNDEFAKAFAEMRKIKDDEDLMPVVGSMVYKTRNQFFERFYPILDMEQRHEYLKMKDEYEKEKNPQVENRKFFKDRTLEYSERLLELRKKRERRREKR